ncbi:MAG: alpha/beta fold hydrolase [Deltaproteobacteria bacterium]
MGPQVGSAPASERVEFPSRRGSNLVGDLHRGRPGGPAMLLCHGMESSRGGDKQLAITERFIPLGLTVLRFDFSYVGESEGVFEDISISGEMADALGAVDFIQNFLPSRLTLVGSSMGGAVALLVAAAASHVVDAVATIAAVGHASLFLEGLAPAELDQWRRSGRRRWRESWVGTGLLDDAERIDILAAVSSAPQPLLVMHGEADASVPLQHGRDIAGAAGDRAEFEVFEGVGHRFDGPGQLESLIERLATWMGDQGLCDPGNGLA